VVNNTQYKSALNNKKIFEVISQASQELNVDSYVIGGFVRDLILNRDFKKDIDIVAVGSGLNGLKVSHYFNKSTSFQDVWYRHACCVLKTDIEFVEQEKNPTILIVGTPL
jgi:tRNA nucleotidyltransferase (CCA-adding enzyme)